MYLFCTCLLGPSSICKGFVANCGREACLSPVGTAFARLSSPALEGGCRMKPPKQMKPPNALAMAYVSPFQQQNPQLGAISES